MVDAAKTDVKLQLTDWLMQIHSSINVVIRHLGISDKTD